MTKIALTNDLKQLALQQYHSFVNIDLWSLEQEEYDNEHINDEEDNIVVNDTVNIKILNKDIEELLSQDGYGANNWSPLSVYQKYTSNSDFTNIIFTPFDAETDSPITDIIISSEYYNGVFYLELPRFYRTISMHLLTNYYDASDDVVLFHTENIIDYVKENPTTSWMAQNSQEEKNMNEVSIAADNEIGRYLIPLPQYLRKIPSLEIDVFYQYTDENGISANQIGIIDTSIRGYKRQDGTDDMDKEYEDQKTLINTNDNTDKIVTSAERNSNQNDIQQDNYFIYTESDNKFETNAIELNKVYETIVKYINDNIYIEKYNYRGENDSVNRINELTTDGHYNYIFTEWEE